MLAIPIDLNVDGSRYFGYWKIGLLTTYQFALLLLGEDLAQKPDSAKIVSRLGNVLAEVGNFSEATKYFQLVVKLNPYDVNNHSTLAQALVIQERYDEAITALLKKAVGFMLHIGEKETVVKLQKYLELIESKKQ